MPPKMEQSKESQAPSFFANEIEGFTSTYRLSRRENDIVVSLVRNVTNSEDVAKALGISTHTVNNHLKSIFEKTGTKSKTEILSTFLRYAADKMQNKSLFTRRPRVMVLDDDKTICELISNGLSEHGVKVFTLNDPTRLQDAVSTLKIDFVICDVKMPSISGMKLLKQLRQTYRGWPYFIFTMGHPDYSLEECLNQGAAGFIEKPIDIDKLFRMIMEHLVESDNEKKALMQASSADTVVLNEVYTLGPDGVGFGGAFVPIDDAAQRRAKLNVGTLVELKILPAESKHVLKVRAQIVWKRAEASTSLSPGIGIKFVSMSDADEMLLHDYLHAHTTKSFIPLGQPATDETQLRSAQ